MKQDYRSLVSFSVHNLKDKFRYNEFDIVFLRNVLIYFDENSRNIVLENISKSLKKNGILFLGYAEGLGDLKPYFESVEPSIYRYNGGVKF